MVRVTDTGWDELVRDLAARVAVYAPDWTESSDSDPGITIVELFAFLGESLLARADQIPERRVRLLAELARLERLAASDCDDATLVRPRFFAGQVLTAADLEREQDYHRTKHRRHNRLLHGTGVVWGFDVSLDDAGKGGRPGISVSPGVAIDANGEELVLCERTTSRIPPRLTACYVSVRLEERATTPEPEGEATRVEESAEVVIQEALASGHLPIARLVRKGGAWTVEASFQRPRAAR